MLGDKRPYSSSSSSTWASGSPTSDTWAVRPNTSIFNSVRRKASKASQYFKDSSFRTPTETFTSRTYSFDGDSATLRPVLSAVSRNQSPVAERTWVDLLSSACCSDSILLVPSFQWIRGDLIGKGSYGRVYWALNVTTGDVIAVKQVDVARGAMQSKHEKESIDALKFESNTLKDLDHPNIVQYLGFEEGEDHISIFMQYIAGGSVGTCLKNGRFSNEVTKSFARQILEGLEYLHSRGIIHRVSPFKFQVASQGRPAYISPGHQGR